MDPFLKGVLYGLLLMFTIPVIGIFWAKFILLPLINWMLKTKIK